MAPYPALRDEVVVHLYPDSIHIAAGPGTGKVLKPDAWEVLRLCTGQMDIREITETISANYDAHPASLEALLKSAEARGYLAWRESPSTAKFRVFGDGRSCMPKLVTLKLTSKCNLRCVYCYGDHGPEKDAFFPADRADWLFDLVSEGGAVAIELTGGEPLLHPSFSAILRSALRRFQVTILSNGTAFTPEVYDIVDQHRSSILIQISVDGSDETVSARLRQVPGTAERTFATIEQLLAIGVSLRVGCVLTPDNVDDCLRLCERLRDIGVTRLALSTAVNLGRAAGAALEGGRVCLNSAEPWLSRVNAVILRALEKYPDVVIDPAQVAENLSTQVMAGANCGAGWQKIVIDPNGDVLPCVILDSSAGRLGNVFSDDLHTMVNAHPLAKACRAFVIHDSEPDCLACRYALHCRRCMARVYMANLRRVRSGEGLCPIAQGLDGAFDFSARLPVAVSTQWGD